MGFRFFKRVPLLPGLRINFSKSGASLSIGHRGGWLTVGRRGTRATIGLPGTGLYYTETVPPAAAPHAGHQAWFALVVILAVMLIGALISI